MGYRGQLKNSARHIYAKRVLRMDEDSGQMTAGEMYDGRGELWRVKKLDKPQITVLRLPPAGPLVGSGFMISSRVATWCCNLSQDVQPML